MTYGDKIISISKFIDDHIRHFFPEVKHKLVQINRGIDTKNFDLNSVSQIRKEKILSDLSIPKGHMSFCYQVDYLHGKDRLLVLMLWTMF